MHKSQALQSEMNKLKQQLRSAYVKKAYPFVKDLEILRKICMTIVLVVCVLAFVFFIFLKNYITTTFVISPQEGIILILPYLMFGLPPLILFNILISKTISFYTKSFKKYYNILAESVGLKWVQGDLTELPCEIQNSKLFLPASKINYDDIFAGKRNNVSIRITEAEIIDDGYRINNGGKESHSSISIFKGVIVILKSNKNIPCTALIKPKSEFGMYIKLILSNFPILFWGVIGLLIVIASISYMIYDGDFSLDNWLLLFCGLAFGTVFGGWSLYNCFFRNKADKKDLQEIQLEDTELEKYYKAYSYNQIEGRYLLTPAFIERFLNISKIFKNNKIRSSYVDNYLVIAIPNKTNMFEIGNLFMSLNNPKHIDKFLNQIASILVLVDNFKLDEKTNL